MGLIRFITVDRVIRAIRVIDALNSHIGRAVAWAALAMVLIQFTVVVMRYVFAIGSIAMQETIWYLHAILFMAGAGYTLLHDGHVRIDVIYRQATETTRALIDLVGALVFLLPLTLLTLWLSAGYVTASWSVLEASSDVGGLPLVFALKTVIWLFAVLLGLQGLALAARSAFALIGRSVPPPPVS